VKSLPIAWDFSLPPTSSRLIVDRDGYELLVTAFAEEGFGPVRIEEVILVTGYLERELNLVAFLLTDGDVRRIELGDPIVDVVAHICAAFHDYSRPYVELRAVWDARKAKMRNLEALEPILRLLLEFYADVESSYLACAVVDVTVTHSRRPPWWASKPSIVSKMERWKRILAFEITNGRSVGVLLDKINAMHTVLRSLEKSAARQSADVFVAASAFCYCCAEIQHRRGLPGISLMMLNRAVEYILTALALDAGLASVRSDTILLVSGGPIGVSSLIRSLVDAGKVAPNMLSGHPFNAVNTSRNQLGYTHGLAEVSSVDVAAVLGVVGQEIRNLDPTLGWWSKVKDLRPDITDSKVLVASALDFWRLIVRVDPERLRRDMDRQPA
jgi:hypothetical protein